MTENGADVMHSSPQRRRRSGIFRTVFLVLVALLATGCSAATVTSGDSNEGEAPAAASSVPAAQETAPTSIESAGADESAAQTQADVDPDAAVETGSAPEPTPTPHPIALADTELPRAPIGFDSLFETGPTGPQPVSIAIENIDVTDAEIIPVGVNQDDLSFEVPPADQVGWYEYGSAPGEAGSAVLAAHIAYNGEDGVFRYLENVEIGAVVVVGFDDGTSMRYQIEDVAEYDKEALPDSLWSRDGREQLALITCGGAFNYAEDSYESNTVAIAVPLA